MNRKALAGIETKAAPLGQAVAIFSRFGGPPDADNDITDPGAFTDGAEVPISAYNHASWGPALPVGKATIRLQSDRAEAELKFFMSTAGGRETFEVLRELGSLAQWSYGYDVVDSEPGQWAGKPVRVLKRLKVHEVSPVLLGAGRETMTVAGSMKGSAGADDLLAIRHRWLGPGDPAVRQEMRAIRDQLELRRAGDLLEATAGYTWYAACEAPSPSADHLARAALTAACRNLAIPLPYLRWARRETSEEASYAERWGARDWPALVTPVPVWGLWDAPDSTIWITTETPLGRLAEVVAHEARHAAGGNEEDAAAYEARWRSR